MSDAYNMNAPFIRPLIQLFHPATYSLLPILCLPSGRFVVQCRHSNSDFIFSLTLDSYRKVASHCLPPRVFSETPSPCVGAPPLSYTIIIPPPLGSHRNVKCEYAFFVLEHSHIPARTRSATTHSAWNRGTS